MNTTSAQPWTLRFAVAQRVIAVAALCVAATGCAAGDGAPAITQVTELSDTYRDDGTYEVFATVLGRPDVAHVRLYYTRADAADFQAIEMKPMAALRPNFFIGSSWYLGSVALR